MYVHKYHQSNNYHPFVYKKKKENGRISSDFNTISSEFRTIYMKEVGSWYNIRRKR